MHPFVDKLHYHGKLVYRHAKKHHKKYLWGIAGFFGLVKLFSFLFVSVSALVITQASVSDISLDIPATSLVDQGMSQIQFSLTDLNIDDIDMITDISFTLPLDTSNSYIDVYLATDTALDTSVYTLHTNGNNLWTLPTSVLSGVYNQLLTSTTSLTLQIPGGLLTDIQNVSLHISYLPTINISQSEEELPDVDSYLVVNHPVDTQNTPELLDDAVTQQDLLLQSADKTISVAIPETTVITDATGDKYYGELLPPQSLPLDELDYPEADNVKYAFSVGNPDESLHFVDTGNDAQSLLFTVQVDSGTFASGQQVLTYYADATDISLQFLSLALVQSDSSGNLFVQLQADHMTNFFIEGYEKDALQFFVGNEDCTVELNTINFPDRDKSPALYLCVVGNQDALNTMYDMRYSFISQEDLENNVPLYGFFNQNYQVTLSDFTSQDQGNLVVYAEYRYGSSLKVSVQDSVRIAKIVGDQYTTYAEGSNVPLDLTFDNIYTVIQNTSDYSKLSIDTSMREKALHAFVGQNYWNTSFWDGTLYAPTQVTDTRQAVQGETGLYQGFVPLKTVWAGIELASIESLGAMFELSVYVGDTSLVPGDVARIYYSYDGAQWSDDQQGCVVDSSYFCTFRSSHMTLFAIGAAPYDKPRSSMEFLNDEFWNIQPNATQLTRALFGDDDLSEMTAYTTLRNSACDISAMSYVSIDVNNLYLLDTLSSNTVYVIEPDVYLFDQIDINNVSCVALVGRGEVTIQGTQNYAVYIGESSSQIIIDNIAFDGQGSRGIYIGGGISVNLTFNNLQIFGQDGNGIDSNDSQNLLINNTQSFSNKRDGVALYGTTLSAVVNSQLYNNDRNGYYIGAGNSYCSINNSLLYNNVTEGVAVVNSSDIIVNNSQMYNNGGMGASFAADVLEVYWHQSHAFNNYTTPQVSTDPANNGYYYGTNIAYPYEGFEYFSPAYESALGRDYGALQTDDWGFNCDLVSNPLNGSGVFFNDTGSCSSVGTIGWDIIFPITYLYGNNMRDQYYIRRQLPPVVNFDLGLSLIPYHGHRFIGEYDYDVANTDINPPVVFFTGSTPVSGTTTYNNFSVTSYIYEPNLVSLTWQEAGPSGTGYYNVYDYNNLVFMSNFDGIPGIKDRDPNTTVTDVSPSHVFGNVLGQVVWTGNGKRGGAYYFGGASTAETGYIKIPHTSYSLDMTDAYSLVAWIKPNSLTEYQSIFARGEVGSHDMLLYLDSSSLGLFHNISNGGSPYATSLTAPPSGDWTHIVVTFSGTSTNSGTLKLYYNGVYITGISNVSKPLDTDTSRMIGGSEDGTILGADRFFKGYIDEPRIYRRALSSGEIAQMYYSNLSAAEDHWEYTANYTNVANWANGRYSFGWKGNYNADGIQDIGMQTTGALTYVNVQQYTCGGTGFSIAWNNDNFITGAFRNQNPTDCDIVLALYGTGSGGGDRTAYTRYRSGSNPWFGFTARTGQCNYNNMDVVRLTGGTNRLSYFTGYTIYVLASGTYIQTTFMQNLGNKLCTAFVGTTGVAQIQVNSGTNSSFLDFARHSYAIVDTVTFDFYPESSYLWAINLGYDSILQNITIDAQWSNNGIQGIDTPNDATNHQYLGSSIMNSTLILDSNNPTFRGHAGVLFHSGFYRIENVSIEGSFMGISDSSINGGIISGVKLFDNSRGIYLTSARATQISNSQIFGNLQGITINNSNNVTIHDTQLYNNTSLAIYLNSTISVVSGVTMNNLQIFNNEYGIQTTHDSLDYNPKSFITLNNSQIYNNSGDGLLLYRTQNFVINNSHIYNNSGNGLYFAGDNNTSGIINNSAFYNNGARGIYIYSGNHLRYGKLITFDNLINITISNGSLNAGLASTYSALGWTGGVLDFTPCMSCSWITNPNTLSYVKLINTTTYPYCSMKGVNAAWTPGTGLTYLHGINITGQKLPVMWSGSVLTGSPLAYSGVKKVAEVNSGGVYSSTSCATDSCLATWDNDNFLDESFWAMNPSAANIICALYGSGSSDTTAYTKVWGTPDYCRSVSPSVVYTGTLNSNVSGNNKVFVVPPGTYPYTYTGILGSCVAIISSGGALLSGTAPIAIQNGYVILDNLYVNGSPTFGIHISEINLGVTLHRTHVFDTWTGIYLNHVYRTLLDNVSVYNTYAGIFAGQANMVINNSQIFNSTGDGLIIALGGIRNTINHSLIYNNGNNGIMITGTDSPIIHATMIYNNMNHGIAATNVSQLWLSDTWIYRNKSYGYYGINDVARYYNNNYMFGNSTNIFSSDFGTGTGHPLAGWEDGIMDTSLSVTNIFDYFVNPRNASGAYLLSSWSAGQGKRTFVETPPLIYSFGTGILLQDAPVFWLSGLELQPNYADYTKYIGGSTTRYTGSLAIASLTNTTGLVVTGLASTSQVSGYSVFGDVLTSAINTTINTQTGIFLTTSNGTKGVIAQIFSPSNFATHFVTSSILDTTNPTGTISIKAGAFYASGTSVPLTLSASDTNGVAQMRFSCNNSTWSTAETYATTKTRDLVSGSGCSAGDGTKTVYVQYKDNANNRSTATISDTIVLDTTNPTGSISVNTGASYTSGAVVYLALSSSDTNGVSGMQFSCNAGGPWSVYEPFTGNKTWNITNGSGCSAGDGFKRVYVRYKDAAGNDWSSTVVDGITLDTTAPTLTFTDNVATGPINADTITASWGDATTAKWTYDNDGVCPAALAANYTYTSSSSINQTTEANNTKYICLLGIDAAGNAATLVSANDINIDITPPVVSTGYISIGTTGINGNTGYFKGSITLAATVSDTIGLSGATCAYTTGVTWGAATYNAGVCTASLAPTATIAIRFRIADQAGNITTGATGTYVYDVTGPASVSPLSPVSGSYLNTGTFGLLWSVAADAGIGVSGYYFQLATGNTFARIILSGTLYTTGVTVTGLTDATYYRRVYPFDRFANTGSWSSIPYVTIKTNQPSVTNVTSTTSNGYYNTGSIYITIKFTEPVFVNTINGVPKLLLNSR